MTEAFPTHTAPAPAMGQWRRQMAPGLVAGVIGLATAWFALPVVVGIPFGGLALNLTLAWGAYTVITIGIHLRPESHSLWVPAIAPWIAVPMLLRMHLVAMGEPMQAWMATTWTLEALAVTAAVATALAHSHLLEQYASTRAALATTGGLGLALAAVMALLHLTMPEPVRTGAITVFVLAVSGVAVALLAQYFGFRRATPTRFRALAGGAALAATASQLLDGLVTYFAVVDPFDLLVQDMREQVALSAWLLEHTGIGYPLVKWALALGIAFVLERGWSKAAEPAAQRTGTYLALIFIGLGPALYSTASLLA